MLRIILRSLVDFMRNHDQMYAAAISCFFMLSFIPFFIFLVSVLSLVLAGREAFKAFLLDRISGFFPAITAEITDELLMLIRHSDVGLFTLLGYLFFSYHLYVSLEASVNHVFKLRDERSMVKSAINSLLVITVLMCLIIVVFGTTIVLSFVVHLGELIELPRLDILIGLVGFLVPFILVFLAATVLYMYLPTKRVSLNNAMKGGLFTAIFLEAAKYVFTFYVAVKLAQFGAFYGSLTGVVIFLTWLLYSASIFLVGAGIVKNLES
jgi:membrane protein